MRATLSGTLALLLLAGGAYAQSFTTSSCTADEGANKNDVWHLGHQERVCELRRTVLPARALVKVTGRNGGIEVIGEDRQDIALEARVVGVASSRDDAQSIVRQVKIDTGDTIRADGPSTLGWNRRDWYVNFRLLVPRHLATQLQTVNGGLDLRGLNGKEDAETTNGGIRLRDLAGDVHVRTTNGGIAVGLGGERWDGQGLDASTTNGGITVGLPEHYAARVIAQATNGGISIKVPMQGVEMARKHIDVSLGGGGATLQFQTVNGGVTFGRPTHGDPE